ncbi:MAG: adenylosuccinate lyase [Candidatus Hydrothermarchaeota archaeon]
MSIHPIEERYGSSEMREIFKEESKLMRLLKVEVALAKAHADLDNIPREAAEIIENSYQKVKIERVKEIDKIIQHDLMAVVKALAEVCGDYGEYVHLGATSSDILDTALALQFRDALKIVEKDLKEIRKLLTKLAEEHRETVLVGRTHGQHAIPTTLGLKFAIWAMEFDRHLERLEESRKRILVGKMSGAVGTQAGLGEKAIEVQKLTMEYLGLKPAMVSNQVIQRDRHAELIMLLSLIASTLEKIGKEIRNLQRTEIRELEEPFLEEQVGSSTMPHKRNPYRSERVCGLARILRSNVLPALENIALEHERDLTNSSCERVIIPETFLLLDEMLKTMRYVLENLITYPENMKKNLLLSKDLIMSERIMLFLAKKGLGRQKAHEIVRVSSMTAFTKKMDLKEVLLENEEVKAIVTEKELEEILDPFNYIGTAREQVDMVVNYLKSRQ